MCVSSVEAHLDSSPRFQDGFIVHGKWFRRLGRFFTSGSVVTSVWPLKTVLRSDNNQLRRLGGFLNDGFDLLEDLVGAAGFEPTTCSTQNCRATRLRYTPMIQETTSIHA
jgi:hypothetical protein